MRLLYDIAMDPVGGAPVPAAAPPTTAPPPVTTTPANPTAGSPGPGGVGGGNPPPAPTAPKGYTVTTTQQRSDWNNFLNYAGKQPGANLSDPKQQTALLASYKKANPNFSVTADQIPSIQYEAYQLRKGDSFGNLGTKELGYLRQGLSPNFINTDPGNIGKLYYPQHDAYGTDLENYYNSKFNPGAAKPPAVTATPSASAPVPGAPATPAAVPAKSTAAPPGAIARPDYTDPNSRLNYAKQIVQKYGPIMKGYGDTFLRVNETPRYASGSAKDITTAAASKVGIDPALLYSSAMVEGMSGNFKNQQGEYDYDRSGNSDKYPVNSSADFGLDQIHSEIPRLQQKGYLDPNLDYTKHIHPAGEIGSGGKPVTQNDVDFKSTEDAMAAKAAYLKDNYDDIDAYAKQKGIALSPKARDFFALVNYNAGAGNGHKMLADYAAAGALKDDGFLNARPTSGGNLKANSWSVPYENVIRRVKMADALHKEKLFD